MNLGFAETSKNEANYGDVDDRLARGRDWLGECAPANRRSAPRPSVAAIPEGGSLERFTISTVQRYNLRALFNTVPALPRW